MDDLFDLAFTVLGAIVRPATFVVFFVLALLAGGTFAWAGAFYNEHDAACTVTSMDRGADHNGNSHYRIYTTECGVLADEDSFLRGKFDSADLWAQVHPGNRYTFRVVGYRLGLTSHFPNILAVTPAPVAATSPALVPAGPVSLGGAR